MHPPQPLHGNVSAFAAMGPDDPLNSFYPPASYMPYASQGYWIPGNPFPHIPQNPAIPTPGTWYFGDESQNFGRTAGEGSNTG